MIVEPPVTGSPLRRLGSPSVQRAWWATLARNKRSLALDSSRPEASDVVARLAAIAPGAVFRDDTSLGATFAQAGDGVLQDLYLYATGADRPDLWPWSTRGEFAAAASGVMALTGFADGPAVSPEMPLADYCAGALGLSAALAELHAARRGCRKPRPISFALHEALMRMNEWQVGVATAAGCAERRNGNRFPMNANIGNIFRTRDGKLLTVSAATPAVATRLLEMIGGEALAKDHRFATPMARRDNMDELNDRLAAWIAERDAVSVMEMARARDVVVGRIMDAGEVCSHPQIIARKNIAKVDGIAMPAPVPRFAGTVPAVPASPPRVGQHSMDILCELGFSVAECTELLACGAVWREGEGTRSSDATSRSN